MITFGGIYIGTYEISLKIVEMTRGKGIKVIDYIKSHVELGEDALDDGIIDNDTIDGICVRLNEYKKIIKSYKCNDFMAYGGTTLYRAKNCIFVLDKIKKTTGIDVELLSNTEHRMLTYRCVTADDAFAKMIAKNTAIVHVGGADLQITLFDNGKLLTTEHLTTGSIKLYESVKNLPGSREIKHGVMMELIDKELSVFMARCRIESVSNIILMGDFSVEATKKSKDIDGTINAEKFIRFLDKIRANMNDNIAELIGVSDDYEYLVLPSLVIYRRVVEMLGAKKILVPGIDISDGIAYDYAIKKNILKPVHDLEKDVISAARFMADKYSSYSPHIETLMENATLIFKGTKSIHDMGKRELLLLRCAALLHDCGKYVSLRNAADNAYRIIMSSEIMGLSHTERLIVANIVKYNTHKLVDYNSFEDDLSLEEYLVVAKCAGIMRISNALDRSHKQKFEKITVALQDGEMVITVHSKDDLLLERNIFEYRSDTFAQVFSIKPVIKVKKV